MKNPDDLALHGVDRYKVIDFLNAIGLEETFVVSLCIDPHWVDVTIAATNEADTRLSYYNHGEWLPVTHSIRMPIVDVKP